MTMRRAAPIARQAGAALLAAMLTVTLVATLAAAALWQQWRAVEVESAERARVQAAWVLVGALDWARLILREDGRAGGPDHLAEPWAVPLEEARLSSFLSAEKNIASDALEGLPDAFLSGRIVDAQSRLNVLNLVEGNRPAPTAVAAFAKLFELLGLPAGELSLLTTGVQRATAGAAASAPVVSR
ncbi:MAG: general secretion pathway protein GspK, partial [Comamonadaceae bacterium]